MTPAEFKRKWARYSGKETSAYQEHFNDLCALLGHPSPAAADPTGSESFCFQKRVIKDEELFAFTDAGRVAEESNGDRERGFADVWKKGFFAWEYKGKKKNLDAAYQQLLRYRESLLNPPLLVVCDFDRYVVRTNFNGTIQETHEFTNANIDVSTVLHLLRAVFNDPEFLKPQRTTAEVTEKLAVKIGDVARSLQDRESIELADAKTRKEHAVAQRKNLRIARFLNRIVFCFFAEDTGLLPQNIVAEIFKHGVDDPEHFSQTLEDLFSTMASGGRFGKDKIKHFNGHLFEEATVFQLNEKEISALAEAAEADWQFIQPSIMGTLFERALERAQRSQIGAHYTSEEDILTLVEPVLMAPLRREWSEIKRPLAKAFARGEGSTSDRTKLLAFQKKIATLSVLDPACGSGNFLYVAIKLLLDLEKEVVAFATQLGFTLQPRVSVQQLKAIEINPYAFELAQVSVQIGYLQWRRDNGFDNEHEPVLQALDNFQNEDALLVPHFRSKPKSLKEARAGEHAADDALKFYTEREWPKSDVVVGNPPFLGGKFLRRELGDAYVNELFSVYGKRVEPQADLCCYWFEKGREQIAEKNCHRVGLLATQGIRGRANRETLKRVKESGDIFFAESDRPWILDGANVHVSMIGFDKGAEKSRTLDGKTVSEINSNLTAVSADITTAAQLVANIDIAFMGDTKVGPFEFEERIALPLLEATNPNSRPSSDVIRPWVNGIDVTRRSQSLWNIDFPPGITEADSAKYEAPFEHIRKHVRPVRATARSGDRTGVAWWIHQRPRPDMRKQIEVLPRFIATPTVSKHRLFVWLHNPTLPDHQLIVFSRDDDYFFGVVHSRFHEVWARAQGTQVRERESGFRYTPTTCFETFPFPEPNDKQKIAIAKAAKELNELRENWLNPPEWTITRILEFPGATNGPWARFIVDPNERGIGTVRYPRLEARDDECAKKLAKRTLTNLYNERPAWLAHAHAKLDAAVAAAYGWSDLIDILERGKMGEIYDFKSYTWSIVDCTPEGLAEILTKLEKQVDEQILKRLLALNLERAAAEKKATAAPKKRASRAKSEEELI